MSRSILFLHILKDLLGTCNFQRLGWWSDHSTAIPEVHIDVWKSFRKTIRTTRNGDGHGWSGQLLSFKVLPLKWVAHSGTMTILKDWIWVGKTLLAAILLHMRWAICLCKFDMQSDQVPLFKANYDIRQLQPVCWLALISWSFSAPFGMCLVGFFGQPHESQGPWAAELHGRPHEPLQEAPGRQIWHLYIWHLEKLIPRYQTSWKNIKLIYLLHFTFILLFLFSDSDMWLPGKRVRGWMMLIAEAV